MLLNEPEATLVIPTYNKAPRLRLALMSYLGLKERDKLEIIIVDDGSGDETQDIIKEVKKKLEIAGLRIGVVNTAHRGRSYARNAGIKESSGKVIIFTDDDLLLDKNFITGHLQGHSRYSHLVLHGRIYRVPYVKFFRDPATGEKWDGTFTDGYLADKVIKEDYFQTDRLDWFLKRNIKLNKLERDICQLYQATAESESNYRWVGVNGGNFSAQRADLINCGMFDTNMGRLWGAEDLELGYRLYLDGCRFMYEYNASNYHLDHFREDFKKQHQEAMGYFMEKHQALEIRYLNEYFEGQLTSLLEWRKQCERGRKHSCQL